MNAFFTLTASVLIAALGSVTLAQCSDETPLSEAVSLTKSGYPAFQFQVSCQSEQFFKYKIWEKTLKNSRLTPFKVRETFLLPTGYHAHGKKWSVLLARESNKFTMTLSYKGNAVKKTVSVKRTN